MTRGLVQRASVVVCKPVGTILKLAGTRNFKVIVVIYCGKLIFLQKKNESPIFSSFTVSRNFLIFRVFFHMIKTENKKPFGPIRNLFSFSTEKR